MTTIMFGFFGEGNTDYAYIIPIVERLVAEILPHVDVAPTVALHTEEESQIDKLVDVAKQARGLFFVVVHLDADGRDLKRAVAERFTPGLDRIRQQPEGLNQHVVPIVPIKETEAWMLVDFDAFRDITYTKLSASDLGFPDYPGKVETIEAKAVFEAALRKCSRKRYPLSPADVYTRLADYRSCPPAQSARFSDL